MGAGLGEEVGLATVAGFPAGIAAGIAPVFAIGVDVGFGDGVGEAVPVKEGRGLPAKVARKAGSMVGGTSIPLVPSQLARVHPSQDPGVIVRLSKPNCE